MRQSSLFAEAKGHIGTDESGKGDYYGPLTVAGFFLPEGQEEVLLGAVSPVRVETDGEDHNEV